MVITGPTRLRPRLLVIGHGASTTGYARVIRSVLEHIAEDFDVHLFDIHRPASSLPASSAGAPPRWTRHANPIRADLHGRHSLPGVLETVQPELIWMVHDLYLNSTLQPLFAAHAPQAKVVLYSPIDGEIEDVDKLSAVAGVDALVLFTESARQLVESGMRELSRRDHGFCPPPIEVIPHGVDTEVFPPLPDGPARKAARRALRAEMFPRHPQLANGFLVLNANRNQPRKRMDLTLTAFALLIHERQCPAWLYLHMGMRDLGYDILALAHQLDITD
ncbi:MAG: hypothetical protein AAFY88_22655, partial [Acidobacteriota bacterium]